MPNLNQLAQDYAYSDNYYATTHPSIGNYFSLTTGVIVTNNNSTHGSTSPVAIDNLARRMIEEGKRWKEYSEGLPSPGYMGSNNGGYVEHHNPFSYFTDVRNSAEQRQNLVPFKYFTTALANDALPDFCLIVPNNQHNGHDGTLAASDTWLQQNVIGPLLANPTFAATGTLIVVYDEATLDSSTDFSATQHMGGGGKVALIVAGPGIKQNYISTELRHHADTTRFIADQVNIPTPDGAVH